MKNIVVLGSTGSIGVQTLQIAAQFPDRLRVVGLAANRNIDQLLEQGRHFPDARLVIADAGQDVPAGVMKGEEALVDLALDHDVDLVVEAIVGAGGLNVTLAALRADKVVALANKETLVMAGPVIQRQLQSSGMLVPIDSEHSAIWQCVQGEPKDSIERIVLTASGGAFRDLSPEELASVTSERALSHPTWVMGPKVTVDSATLMNKGLEVLEAILLFDLRVTDIQVVMHRESIIHSLVYFKDSSVKAQLALPDMSLPIQYALTHPDRWTNSFDRLDLAEIGTLRFSSVPAGRYPCLDLALTAANEGGTVPAVLCAADEIAVDLFLRGVIPFSSISNLVAHTLERHEKVGDPDLEAILEADRFGRDTCRRLAGIAIPEALD